MKSNALGAMSKVPRAGFMVFSGQAELSGMRFVALVS